MGVARMNTILNAFFLVILMLIALAVMRDISNIRHQIEDTGDKITSKIESVSDVQRDFDERLSELESRIDSLAPKEYAMLLAIRNGVDVDIYIRLITQESKWDPAAESHAGARGLGQIMPFNASRCGLTDNELWEWKKNLECSIKFFADAVRYWKGDYRMALCEYNAGRNACLNRNAAQSFRETRRYISKILDGA